MYKRQECSKLTNCSEREKWKTIERLTNQSNFNEVQPIRKVENGKTYFLFCDDHILKEFEDHHIRKIPDCHVANSNLQEPILKESNTSNNTGGMSNQTIDAAMNAEISDHEVSLTFGK